MIGTQACRRVERNLVGAGKMIEHADPADESIVVQHAEIRQRNHHCWRQDVGGPLGRGPQHLRMIGLIIIVGIGARKLALQDNSIRTAAGKRRHTRVGARRYAPRRGPAPTSPARTIPRATTL